jgi:hypothetical protein
MTCVNSSATRMPRHEACIERRRRPKPTIGRGRVQQDRGFDRRRAGPSPVRPSLTFAPRPAGTFARRPVARPSPRTSILLTLPADVLFPAAGRLNPHLIRPKFLPPPIAFPPPWAIMSVSRLDAVIACRPLRSTAERTASRPTASPQGNVGPRRNRTGMPRLSTSVVRCPCDLGAGVEEAARRAAGRPRGPPLFSGRDPEPAPLRIIQ